MSKMTPDEYIRNVLQTEAIDFDKISKRLSNPHTIRLLHAAMGLCTEAGEFTDQLKKVIFYGKQVDLINLFEELGDLLWYIGIAMDEIGLPMEECFKRNIDKLQARYKDKFTETRAENRDLATERKILEGECYTCGGDEYLQPCPTCGQGMLNVAVPDVDGAQHVIRDYLHGPGDEPRLADAHDYIMWIKDCLDGKKFKDCESRFMRDGELPSAGD